MNIRRKRFYLEAFHHSECDRSYGVFEIHGRMIPFSNHYLYLFVLRLSSARDDWALTIFDRIIKTWRKE